MKIIPFLRKSYVNFRGWSTTKKIVVIESDDWGSVRIPDTKTYEYLVNKGLPLHKNRYTLYDGLETPDDLNNLFEVLSAHQDTSFNPAVLTANALPANPDFEKIKDADFTAYFYESVFTTYDRYSSAAAMRTLWDKGISSNLFYPQFHGREHLNPARWLEAVKSCSKEKLCFEQATIPGINLGTPNRINYLAAFDYYNETEKKAIESDLVDGLLLFEATFGFPSKSFIASQSIRGEHINPILAENGVKYHQNGQQLLPFLEDKNHSVRNKYWGYRDAYNLLYWRRNVTFEPSKNKHVDSVNQSLAEIKNAFQMGKPAVINSHRVNYCGALSKDNQSDSLKKLDLLLKTILLKWPDVVFMNSEQLGDFISSSK